MNAQAILGIIHNALTANVAFLDEATQYTTSFCNMLRSYLRQNNSIKVEPPNIKKKLPMILRIERGHVIENPEPTLTNSWNKISSILFCNEPLEKILECTEKQLSVQMRELKFNYSSNIEEIEKSIQNAINEISVIDQQFQAQDTEYQTLCQAIEKSHADPAQKEKYDKLKFKFKGTQKAAVDKIIELNHKIMDYNLQIEQALTKYEKAEYKKFEAFNKCLYDFCETLKLISQMNKNITNNISNEVSTISSQKDVDELVNEPALQKPPARIRLSRNGSLSGNYNSILGLHPNNIPLINKHSSKSEINFFDNSDKSVNSSTPQSANQSPPKRKPPLAESSPDQKAQLNEESQQDEQQKESQQPEPQQNEPNQQSNDQNNQTEKQEETPQQQENQQQPEAQQESPQQLEPQQQSELQQESPQQDIQNQQSNNENSQTENNQEISLQSEQSNPESEEHNAHPEIPIPPSANQFKSSEQFQAAEGNSQLELLQLAKSANQSGNVAHTSSRLTTTTTETTETTTTADELFPNEDEEAELPEGLTDSTFFEITKMFTFNVNNFLSPQEIFDSDLKRYDAVLTEDSGSLHQGDEVTFLKNEGTKNALVFDRHTGEKVSVEASKLQKIFDRKIMKVSKKVEDGELEVEEGEYVLVLESKEGFSRCLSVYREEGLISSDKLVNFDGDSSQS